MGRVFSVELAELKNGDQGECHGEKYTIKINKKLPKALAEQTLFHEAIHAALYVSGHCELLGRDENDIDHEEALVLMIENAFADAIDITKLKV